MGRPVKLTLTSRDVIHSFFVRELRIKQDLVPGMQIPLHFQADVVGTYEVPCSELCGLGHIQMRTTVIVMPSAAITTAGNGGRPTKCDGICLQQITRWSGFNTSGYP